MFNSGWHRTIWWRKIVLHPFYKWKELNCLENEHLKFWAGIPTIGTSVKICAISITKKAAVGLDPYLKSQYIHFSLLFLFPNRNINWLIRGARGVMVIVVGNGHSDTSSNPGRD